MRTVLSLAGATAVTGVFVFGFVACSSSDDPANGAAVDTTTSDGGKDAAADARKPNTTDASYSEPLEEGTVGKACQADSDCAVTGSIGDNVCSNGAFQGNDLYTTPMCVQLGCTIPSTASTIEDFKCDDGKGFCYQGQICFPFCQFDSRGFATGCENGSKCVFANGTLDGTAGAIGFGFCYGMCTSDADCKGTGQKCQLTTGECLAADKVTAPTKQPGEACTTAASGSPQECACESIGGNGADAAKGICRAVCATGPSGDALCGETVTNGKAWKCSAGLPKQSNGQPAFSAEPTDLRGNCAQPCDSDADCTFAVGAVSQKCLETAGGSFCYFP